MLVYLNNGVDKYDVLSTMDAVKTPRRTVTVTPEDLQPPRVISAVILDGANEIPLAEFFKDKPSIELAFMK